MGPVSFKYVKSMQSLHELLAFLTKKTFTTHHGLFACSMSLLSSNFFIFSARATHFLGPNFLLFARWALGGIDVEAMICDLEVDPDHILVCPGKNIFKFALKIEQFVRASQTVIFVPIMTSITGRVGLTGTFSRPSIDVAHCPPVHPGSSIGSYPNLGSKSSSSAEIIT